MAIVKNIKTIDSQYRICLPREWAKPNEKVYFEITKAGNLVIKKVEKVEGIENGEKKNV